MARQTSLVEVNKYVAGLITEATPLNFPDNASIDEDNFVLNTDGSRQRRLGMDFESGHQIISTGVNPPSGVDVTVTSYRWRNAGGNPQKNIIVVQVGNELRFFDMDIKPLSAGVIYAKTYADVPVQSFFSYAVVDGIMTIVNGLKDVSTFKYENGVISESSGHLLVRDQFGVEDNYFGLNLRQGSGVSTRPLTLTDQHVYNLRNQTWGLPKLDYNTPVSAVDPITTFYDFGGNHRYPSNSDSVVDALFANAAYSPDPVSLRFNANSLYSNPVGSFPAPQGFFIIDAMARGTSRVDEYNKVRAANPALGYPIIGLPVDTTPGGPSVVAEYAGRVWYSGFSGSLIAGDNNSPRMASYVLFSQLVQDPTDTLSCYQDGDPTSVDAPELLDSDGGFIRIEGAYGICGMVNVGKALMVIAANGVWQISGGSDYGFKATNYLTNKLTNHGCDSPGSIVVVDNSFMYWGDDGIYSVAPNQFGDYIATNIAKTTIQSFYDAIDSLDKRACKGIYDSYERKIRWVYRNRLRSSAEVRELVLDIALSAFYPSTIKNDVGSGLPKVVSGVQVPAFTTSPVQETITANLDDVTVLGEDVTVTIATQAPTTKETVYVVLTSVSPNIQFTFSSYKNEDFKDWLSLNNVGYDANAYIVTGWMAGNDYQRIKQVPYITFHFIKTEDGFVLDESGDYIVTHPSSCLVQAQWEWANSPNSGRWGKKFQAYRFKRHYFPTGLGDTYENGNYTVETKNKLRGKGKVLSLLIETEPEKDCVLLGWSMILEVNQYV